MTFGMDSQTGGGDTRNDIRAGLLILDLKEVEL